MADRTNDREPPPAAPLGILRGTDSPGSNESLFALASAVAHPQISGQPPQPSSNSRSSLSLVVSGALLLLLLAPFAFVYLTLGLALTILTSPLWVPLVVALLLAGMAVVSAAEFVLTAGYLVYSWFPRLWELQQNGSIKRKEATGIIADLARGLFYMQRNPEKPRPDSNPTTLTPSTL